MQSQIGFVERSFVGNKKTKDASFITTAKEIKDCDLQETDQEDVDYCLSAVNELKMDGVLALKNVKIVVTVHVVVHQTYIHYKKRENFCCF